MACHKIINIHLVNSYSLIFLDILFKNSTKNQRQFHSYGNATIMSTVQKGNKFLTFHYVDGIRYFFEKSKPGEHV